MFVRIARFEGAGSEGVDDQIREIQGQLERGRAGDLELPEALRRVRRITVLADRAGGTWANMVTCDTEEELRAAHEALSEMTPGSGGGHRVSVDLFEVALDVTM